MVAVAVLALVVGDANAFGRRNHQCKCSTTKTTTSTTTCSACAPAAVAQPAQSTPAPVTATPAVAAPAQSGCSGGVCNMTFFNKPLTYTQIYYLYELFKNKTPPITYSNFNKTVVFNPSKNPSNNKKTYTQYGSDTNTTILTQSPAIMQSITNQTTTTTTQNNGNIPTPYVMASPLFTRIFNYVS
jgi:hypothetical protein